MRVSSVLSVLLAPNTTAAPDCCDPPSASNLLGLKQVFHYCRQPREDLWVKTEINHWNMSVCAWITLNFKILEKAVMCTFSLLKLITYCKIII